MKITNCTPHTIDMVDSDDEVIRSYPSEGIARVSTTSLVVGKLDGFPIVVTIFGDVQGLPKPEDGTTYIVSMAVAQAAKRSDVVGPDSGPTALRYTEGPRKGQIIGVRGFTQYHNWSSHPFRVGDRVTPLRGLLIDEAATIIALSYDGDIPTIYVKYDKTGEQLAMTPDFGVADPSTIWYHADAHSWKQI